MEVSIGEPALFWDGRYMTFKTRAAVSNFIHFMRESKLDLWHTQAPELLLG